MLRRMWVAAMICGMVHSVALAQPEPTARELPRWRGFNLLEMFYKGSSTGPFKEDDFRLISELGFNFVRLPMDYRVWIVGGDCLKNWQQAGFGWALWNFRGSLGVLDSGRADVPYEDFRAHKLDRRMMDLLQRY